MTEATQEKPPGLLSTVEKPHDMPIICTITGDAGIGKTTLAAAFPNPIVIRVEDGLQAIPSDKRPDAFPMIKDVPDIWDQLASLIREDHNYKTLIIDSITKLDQMFVQYVVDTDEKKPKSINQALGGYGAGINAVAAMHMRVRKAAEVMRQRKGMNVVFIAHADTETLELPDQDSYTRYSLRLNKKSVAPYVDDVDLVGFLKLETYTMGDGERKKAISDGVRLLITYTTAANISKNRYGIVADLPVEIGVNPLTQYVPFLANNQEVKNDG